MRSALRRLSSIRPGSFASTEELVEIAGATADYGGVYITHMRSEADQFLEAIDEAIEIGVRAGVPVEIYHLKAGGKRNWHKALLAISKIDSVRAAGVDVQANMYPYIAGGTGLTACFPPWASANGRLFDNLADDEMRARIRSEIESGTESWENLCALAMPSGVLVLGVDKPENRKYAGRYLGDIAAEMGTDWIDAAMELVLDERQRVGTIYFLMSEENLSLQMQQSWIKFGTDAGGVDPETTGVLVHPRSYGTYPRILGRYVREQGVISLEDAIRKMSSAVATRLSIQDRGVLREGFWADVVIFDPKTIIDRATYETPHQLSLGVRHVFVNGVAVVRGRTAHRGEARNDRARPRIPGPCRCTELGRVVDGAGAGAPVSADTTPKSGQSGAVQKDSPGLSPVLMSPPRAAGSGGPLSDAPPIPWSVRRARVHWMPPPLGWPETLNTRPGASRGRHERRRLPHRSPTGGLASGGSLP